MDTRTVQSLTVAQRNACDGILHVLLAQILKMHAEVFACTGDPSRENEVIDAWCCHASSLVDARWTWLLRVFEYDTWCTGSRSNTFGGERPFERC